MAHLPGPHQIRIFYTTNAGGLVREHVMALNCTVTSDDTPGQAFAAYDIARRSGVDLAANTIVEDWVNLIRPLWPNTDTITRAELWKYNPGTNDAFFLSVYDISDAGSAGAANVNDSETIITFRTLGGGSMRLHFYETILGSGLTDASPFTNAVFEAIRAFVVSTNNWILARDDTYPFTALALHPGINERLFKDRFRP